MLQSEIDAGDSNVVFNQETLRYTVESPHIPQNLVVPASENALLPPKRLPTRPVHRFCSAYSIRTTRDGESITAIVPKADIVCDRVRARKSILHENFDRTWTEDSVSGWPRVHEIPRDQVIILGIRAPNGSMCCKWYIASQRTIKVHRAVTTLLVPIPDPLVFVMCTNIMRSNYPATHDMELLQMTTFEGSLQQPFNRVATVRFDRHYKHVTKSIEAKKSTKRSLECCGESNATAANCIICFETCTTAYKRCSRSNCNIPVCGLCNERMRGLCGICDRNALNASYLCSSCTCTVSLDHFGYPCLACGLHNTCRQCYLDFRPCASCDASL